MTDTPTTVGDQAEAFYIPLGAADDGSLRFSPTDYTRSVWDTRIQHGSPPAALLVRAIERGHPRPDVRTSRVTVELLGAVPVSETRVRTRVLRPGRNIELVRAEMDCEQPGGGFRSVASATVWRLSTEDTAAAARSTDPALDVAEPGSVEGFAFFGAVAGTTFLDAVDWRWLTLPSGHDPGRVWATPKVSLVDGEEPSPVERMLAVVDAANGIAATLDPAEWTFLNTEMSVHLHRTPEGQDVGVAAEQSIGPEGIGMCAAVVYDSLGPVARTAQSLLVRKRW